MAVEESLDKIIDYRNLHDMVRATVERCPDKVAYRWILNDNGGYRCCYLGRAFRKG